MIRFVGWCMAAVLVFVLSVNAAFMLASPRRWFRLPRLIRMQGTLLKENYVSGWGAIRIRMMGAVILGGMIWVLCDLLSQERFFPSVKWDMKTLHIASLCIAMVVGIVMTLNAAFMLASPRHWCRLPGWIRVQGFPNDEKTMVGWRAIHLRVTAAVTLVIIAWVLYEKVFWWG